MSMGTFDRLADANQSGSPLRNQAAGYLHAIHGNADIERLVAGKKVDVYCLVDDYDRRTPLIVECKDYAGHLTREQVSRILADYTDVLADEPTGTLLIVTRNGLAPAANALLSRNRQARHLTIWELEDRVLGLTEYVRAQASAFDDEGLRHYYVATRARAAIYDEAQRRSLSDHPEPLFERVQAWLAEDRPPPLAILGGYGAGKTSFSKRLLADQAGKALTDPGARRPILIRLGNVTRASGLDALLGAMFTREHVVRGYSYQRFLDLNERGRLLIVLDGFDEMKHAMSWTDFRNELAELNALNSGDSRVLLLGRPSAFPSDDEHVEVLRGRRRWSGGGHRRLPDWPEFREYDLEAFTRAERVEFVERYLAHHASKAAGDHPARSPAERAREVNVIADQEPEVFGKPVHARILVELALDPAIDLSALAANVTRWTLYTEFFQSLAAREASKPARRPIEPEARLTFLRNIALWLWRQRDGSTSFKVDDLPAELLASLPDGDAETQDEKRREYLTGAFLERKAGDTYFFPHRSFAEFLVAQQLALTPPTPALHATYDPLVRDGVQEFLDEAAAVIQLPAWSETLGDARGTLSFEYLYWLTKHAGGVAQTTARLPTTSPWLPIVAISDVPITGDQPFVEAVADAIRRGTGLQNAMLLYAIGSLGLFSGLTTKDGVTISPLAALTSAIAAALLDRVLDSVREDSAMARLTIDAGDAEVQLRLAQAAVPAIQEVRGDRNALVAWAGVGQTAGALLEKAGYGLFHRHAGPPLDGPVEHAIVPFDRLLARMRPRGRELFRELARRERPLSLISVVQQQRSRQQIQRRR